jgi:hypothetical protein
LAKSSQLSGRVSPVNANRSGAAPVVPVVPVVAVVPWLVEPVRLDDVEVLVPVVPVEP